MLTWWEEKNGFQHSKQALYMPKMNKISTNQEVIKIIISGHTILSRQYNIVVDYLPLMPVNIMIKIDAYILISFLKIILTSN